VRELPCTVNEGAMNRDIYTIIGAIIGTSIAVALGTMFVWSLFPLFGYG
jgi:hypothetical protein